MTLFVASCYRTSLETYEDGVFVLGMHDIEGDEENCFQFICRQFQNNIQVEAGGEFSGLLP